MKNKFLTRVFLFPSERRREEIHREKERAQLRFAFGKAFFQIK